MRPPLSKWLISENTGLLWSCTQPSASAGEAWTDVQLAFLLRRDRGARAGAGGPQQMTGRCVSATASRQLHSLPAPAPGCHLPWGTQVSPQRQWGATPPTPCKHHLQAARAPSGIQHARKWALLNSGVNVHFDQHKLGRKVSVDTRNIYFPFSIVSYLWLFQSCQFAWYFGRALLPLTTNNHVSLPAILFGVD